MYYQTTFGQILAFLLIFLITRSAHANQGHIYKRDDSDIICFLCKPGTYLFSHCTKNFTKSVCKPCKNGTFQSEYTQAQQCEKCKTYCEGDINQIVTHQCNAKQNLKCECRDGYYWDSYNVYGDGHCRKYTPCPHSQVVIQKGTTNEDQKCAYCRNGTFFDDGSCVHCTECAKINATEITPCSNTADAVCDKVTSDDDNNMIGIIIGVVITLLILAGIVTFCIITKCRRKKSVEFPLEMATINESKTHQNQQGTRQRSSSSSNSSLSSRHTQQTGNNAGCMIQQNKPIYKPAAGVHIRPGVAVRREEKNPLLAGVSADKMAVDELIYPHAPSDVWKEHIFREITRCIGCTWQDFIRVLPGDNEYLQHAGIICAHAKMNNPHSTREQIYESLCEWSMQCPDFVTIENIVKSLRRLDDASDTVKHIVCFYNKTVTESLQREPNILNTS